MNVSRRKLLSPLLLLALALLPALPLLLNGGFLNTRGGGDSPFLLFRLHQLITALSDGVFPVRWMPDAAFGLGYPFYNYYAALPLYLAALFKLLGASYVLAIKLTHLVGFMAAAWGMRGWLKAVGASTAAAWLAAVGYTFAPFHMVNVFVRGDSLNEFWAMAIYPLCLWAAARLAQQPSIRRWLMLAFAYAALLLTHNVSALLFSPFLGLYLVFLAVGRVSAANRQQLPAPSISLPVSAAAIVFGAALSAYFWAPALGETSLVQLGEQTTGYFNYANHFRGRDLVQQSVWFNYDVGSGDSTPFAMSAAQIVLTGAALVAVALQWLASALTRRFAFLGHHSVFIVLSLVVATFMITRYSETLWAAVPLLPYAQFPWRFLSVQSLFVAALVGVALDALPNRQPLRMAVLTAGSAMMAGSAMLGLRPDFVSLADADITARRLQTYEYFTGNIGATIRHEYLPQWTQPRPYASDEFIFGDDGVRALALDGVATGERIQKRAAEQQWAMTVNSDSATVAVPLLYFPGWQAWANGAPVEVRPAEGLGWVSFELPQGDHAVRLRFGNTPLRSSAGAVSVAAWLAAVVLSQFWKMRPTRPARAAAWLTAGVLAALALALIGRVINSRSAAHGAATMDFDQLGYLHSSPVPFNNGDVLVNYNLSADELAPGDLLGVSMLWQGGGRAHYELSLVTPAAHLLGAPLPPGKTPTAMGVAGERADAVLAIPVDLPTGVYLLRLKLTEANINVSALTSGGQPRGAMYLRPVRVLRAEAAEVAQPLASITPEVALIGLEATQTDSSAVIISLRWQAAAPPPANYKLALRLRDAQTELAAWDAQPTGGMYPTSSWRVGEVVTEHYGFELPLGLPPGEYPLTLTLYDAATLAPAGTVTQPILLTLWSPPPGSEPQYRFTDTLALHDVRLPGSVNAGETLTWRVRWTSLAQLTEDYMARWTAVSPNGEVVSVADLSLAVIPGSQWAAGAMVIGRPSLPIPADALPGQYTINAQLLDTAGNLLSQALAVGKVQVLASGRTAELPPMQFSSGAAFGSLSLAGYDIALSADGLTLTLHWRALGAAEGDYKYFVHVFDPQDESIVAQHDAFPILPTSRWFAGEVVSETATIALGEAQRGAFYNVAVGWYDANTGQRLGDRIILQTGVVVP